MLRFPRIAFACLSALTLAAPAHARLGVGASAPIEPVKIPAVRDQDQVAAADNGTVTLFVWRDTRAGDGDIRGARVKPDGTVIDPNGLDLASGPGEQSEPAVSWDGTQWLVAWNDQGEIKVERVSPAGVVLDVPQTLSSGTASHPGLAWNGSVHIAVWAEGSLVHAATLDDNGTILAAGAALSQGANDSQPVIAAAGANALVAFKSLRAGNEDVYAVRVTAALPSGALSRLDASDVSLVSHAETQEMPAVASDGAKWLVAWEDLRDRNTTGSDIRGTRVSAAGAVEDAASIAIGVAAGTDRQVALTYTGSRWLATWTSTTSGQLLRAIANNGNPTGPAQSVSNTVPPKGDGAFGGGFVAFSEPSGSESDLLGRVADPLGSPFLLAFQTPNQTEPAQAFGSNRWMVAWLDDRFGAAQRQVRIGLTDSARFEAPNPATIAFAAPRPGIDQDHPTLVFDGTNFNLFWDEQRGSHRIVVGARFTPGGAPIDTFTVAGDAWNQYEPTAGFVPPGDVVIAWTDTRAGALERDIWIAQYQNGAQSGGRKALIQVAGQVEEHPSLAVIQGKYALVAYELKQPLQDRGIEAAYIYFPIATSTPAYNSVAISAGRTFNHPRVDTNGEDGLIAFQEVVFSDGPALHIPMAARWVGDDVYAFSQWQIAPGSYTPAIPVIGSTGYDYLALWSSRLSGTIDLKAAGVNPYGYPVDPDTALTNDPIVDTPGSAAHGLSDRAGFTYMRAMDDSTWSGLQLYGGDARDTLAGEVLINEFLAHPARGNEFIELFNTSGRDFLMNGWTIRVNGQPNVVADCADPIFLSRKDRNPVVNGTPCAFLAEQEFFTDTTFATWQAPDPVEGHLPDRGAVLELYTPGGVLVDRVGYGFRGGAPVSGAIPAAIAPAAKIPGHQAYAVGDSVDLSTARLPNGTNTGSDANDWNVTDNTTANSTNTGTTAQLGTTLFVSRAYWNPSTGQPAIEFLNPSTGTTYDFSGWYLSNNVSTEKIGVGTNAFSQMKPLDVRTLRRNEPGCFTFSMDQFSVLYLFGPDLTRYEQLGWSRPDQLAPDLCATRLGGTGGTHDGFDWFTCGGREDINSGELRYTTCNISAPTTEVLLPGVSALAFAGSFPNPSRLSNPSVLVFTVPGLSGGQPVRARLSLYDVAGRRVATLVDGAFAPGTQRVPLDRVDAARRAIRAGTYYADLEVGGQRVRRTLVFLD